jgi:hypothetical protein
MAKVKSYKNAKMYRSFLLSVHTKVNNFSTSLPWGVPSDHKLTSNNATRIAEGKM